MDRKALHEKNCKVCGHPDREEIERDFIEWKPITVIGRERKLNRAVLYRHVRALNLFAKRDKNIRAALANFIARGYRARVTGAALVSAITAFAKVNADGEWIDKTENVNGNRIQELFLRMTRGEMEAYARDGVLPSWWPPDTRVRNKEDVND